MVNPGSPSLAKYKVLQHNSEILKEHREKTHQLS